MADPKQYFEGVGRRKTAVARVRITEASRHSFVVNDKKLEDYFKTDEQMATAKDPLSVLTAKFKVTVKVSGSGLPAQSEAIRHGLARALEKYDPVLRSELKEKGFLKRDPRKKERKKFGLKKARRAPQWSKR